MKLPTQLMPTTQPIYLDHAAATPLDQNVFEVMLPYLRDQFYNPSAGYAAAQRVDADIEIARAATAHYLGIRPIEILFTAGGTEANNLAIHGVMCRFPKAKIITSAIEHDSVLEASRQYDTQQVPVHPTGIVDLDKLKHIIDDSVVLISVMYANNEIGTIQPIREISQIVAEVRKQRRAAGVRLPLYLHSDAAQAANYLDLHTARLGVDMMTLNGGKIYGLKQSGCLYVKAGLILQPLIYGGGQERGLRSGTENVAAIIGFAKALQLVQDSRQVESKRLLELRDHFVQQLQLAFPSCSINGSLRRRLPNNVHATFPGIDNERLLIQLDEAGVQAAAGSACSASKAESSHVLQAIGMSDAAAHSSIRFTLGRSTTESQLHATIKILGNFVTI